MNKENNKAKQQYVLITSKVHDRKIWHDGFVGAVFELLPDSPVDGENCYKVKGGREYSLIVPEYATIVTLHKDEKGYNYAVTYNGIPKWYIDDTGRVRKCVVHNKEYWDSRPDYARIHACDDPKLIADGILPLRNTPDMEQQSNEIEVAEVDYKNCLHTKAKSTGGAYVKCPDCKDSWTHNEWKNRKKPESDLPAQVGEPKIYICGLCGGDGRETCDNPDHGFIESMPGETGRIGCPVCGHHPKHKVPRGGNCELCNGTGKLTAAEADNFMKVYSHLDVELEEIPAPAEAKEQPENNSATVAQDGFLILAELVRRSNQAWNKNDSCRDQKFREAIDKAMKFMADNSEERSFKIVQSAPQSIPSVGESAEEISHQQKSIDVFNAKAAYNKFLNELTGYEQQVILEMIDEAYASKQVEAAKPNGIKESAERVAELTKNVLFTPVRRPTTKEVEVYVQCPIGEEELWLRTDGHGTEIPIRKKTYTVLEDNQQG